jgi:hypothetical protein
MMSKNCTLILVCIDFIASLGEARIFIFSAGVENFPLSSMHAEIIHISSLHQPIMDIYTVCKAEHDCDGFRAAAVFLAPFRSLRGTPLGPLQKLHDLFQGDGCIGVWPAAAQLSVELPDFGIVGHHARQPAEQLEGFFPQSSRRPAVVVRKVLHDCLHQYFQYLDVSVGAPDVQQPVIGSECLQMKKLAVEKLEALFGLTSWYSAQSMLTTITLSHTCQLS